MTQEIVNIGSAPADGSGDALRVSFDKINKNFTELYTQLTEITSNISPVTNPVLSVAGKTGEVFLGINDIVGGVTTGYVDNRVTQTVAISVSQLLDSAPPQLNSIGKLSTAILNNPNYGTEFSAQLSSKLPITGGTMTGPLRLQANPTSNLEAATKQYVDQTLLNITGIAIPPTSSIGKSGDVSGAFSVDTNFLYVCIQSYDGVTSIWTRTPLSGTW